MYERGRRSLGASDVPMVSIPPPPDVGDVALFSSCKALPRKALTSKEVCQIERLRKSCSPSNDCLVTCLSSPDALKVGGGCDHVFFLICTKMFRRLRDSQNVWNNKTKIVSRLSLT